MHQGTSGAEFIYNEHLARIMTAGFRIKSRTITDPPASPVDFDSYLIPVGGTGEWAGLDGSFVFWHNAWFPMPPQPGFMLYVIDENIWVDFTTNVATQSSAFDGQINVPLVEQAGSERIIWNTGQGLVAYTSLTDNAIFMAPTNMKPGRHYMLRVQQDGIGARTLTLEANKFAGQGLTNPLTISLVINAITDIYLMGPVTPLNIPSIYLVEPVVAAIA